MVPGHADALASMKAIYIDAGLALTYLAERLSP
jgi:hypothetical protein